MRQLGGGFLRGKTPQKGAPISCSSSSYCSCSCCSVLGWARRMGEPCVVVSPSSAHHHVLLWKAVVLHVLIHRAPAGVHEKVGHGGHLQAQLLGDRCLHLFGRTLCFFVNGHQCAPLDVREHQARLLRPRVLRPTRQVVVFPLACCNKETKV